MQTLRNRINLLMKAMEAGIDIKLSSGHVLAMPDNQDEPGFCYWNESNQTEGIMQIGSETAWMSLIHHAKNITEQDCLSLVFSLAMKEPKNEPQSKLAN